MSYRDDLERIKAAPPPDYYTLQAERDRLLRMVEALIEDSDDNWGVRICTESGMESRDDYAQRLWDESEEG